MKYISKAQRQLDGDLLLKADTQALLHRTLRDVYALISAEQSGDKARDPSDCLRAVARLQEALGAFHDDLPTIGEMLGDPKKELVARNLLKLTRI